jgi:hypothetical protein
MSMCSLFLLTHQVVAFVGAYDLATTKWEQENGRVPGDIGTLLT